MNTTAAHTHSPSTTYTIDCLPTTNGTLWADISKCVCGETIGRLEIVGQLDPWTGSWVTGVRFTGARHPRSGHKVVDLPKAA